jgi:uncharacterized protein YbaR (Trm112 family)
MLEPDFLSILVCPSSRQPLREATPAELAAVNRAIADGTAKNRGGAAVQQALTGGLATRSGDVVYPIVDGIPILLTGEAIALPAAKS